MERLLSTEDIGIIVLTWNESDDKEDVQDKWLRQLSNIVPKLPHSTNCLLVNHQNVHYMYCKVFGHVTFEKDELGAYVAEMLEQTTDEEDVDNGGK